MDYNELREIGKIWILMGVFSTCFFASCGQSQTSPPESVTPVTHTQPVAHNTEPLSQNINQNYGSGELDSEYSEELEGSGFGASDFNDLGWGKGDQPKKYPEDIPPPQ